MIRELKKTHNATPPEPLLNYWELRPTKPVRGRIPRYPESEKINTLEMRSALGKILDMQSDPATVARNDQVKAAQAMQSIQGDIPYSYLEHASGIIPQDLPPEVRESALATQRSAAASAQRRMMEQALAVDRHERAEQERSMMIRALHSFRAP